MNRTAEVAAHPDVPVASGLVFRKASRVPHPARHTYSPVVFLCKQQLLPPKQGLNCAAPSWCPHVLMAFYTFVWPLVSQVSLFLQIQQDCQPPELISSWETVTHPSDHYLTKIWPGFIQ